jgi:hypothetical protein
MIYGTVYVNKLTPLAPWLMGQRHHNCFHGIWNQSARLAGLPSHPCNYLTGRRGDPLLVWTIVHTQNTGGGQFHPSSFPASQRPPPPASQWRIPATITHAEVHECPWWSVMWMMPLSRVAARPKRAIGQRRKVGKPLFLGGTLRWLRIDLTSSKSGHLSPLTSQWLPAPKE